MAVNKNREATKQIIAFLRKEFGKRKADVAIIGISGVSTLL